MSELTLNYTGIGSLPFKDENAPQKALDFIFNEFESMPFWPQLPHFSCEEDMIFQYTQGIAGLSFEGDKYFLNPESEEFFIQLEELFFDYENVVNANNLSDCEQTLDKYAILPPNSNTLKPFLNELKGKNPDFVKGSITGPFTFSTSITDNEGKCAYYNDILREVCIKTLSLKALWQVKEFKKAAPKARCIIFMDEPSISQVGSCAFLSVESSDVVEMLKIIANDLKKFNALCGIHCCGKTDWEIALCSGVDIVNFDAYFFSQSVANFASVAKKFIENGGIFAFGIVPTVDSEIKKLNIDTLEEKFNNSIKCFTSKGIDKNLLLKHSFITPSCGCGSLDNEGAIKVLKLAHELSLRLKERYGGLL